MYSGAAGRFIGYSIIFLLVLVLLWTVGQRRLVEHTQTCANELSGIRSNDASALVKAQKMGACLERKNSFLENFLMRGIHEALRSLPNMQSNYVGTWKSSRPNCDYRISLHPDGKFIANPLKCDISSQVFTGSWGVHKDQMVWLPDQGKYWPPDINPIEWPGPNSFVLVEQNGSRTRFIRLNKVELKSLAERDLLHEQPPAQPSTQPPTQPSVQPPQPQPPRWVLADDLRVRGGPGEEHKVIGTLSRGAELILKAPPFGDFCLIEGEGQYGYVACAHLSSERIARPRAGENGIDVAQRWVGGNGVTLREAPRRDANIVGRLSLNAIVKLVREEAGSGYCEVQPASGSSGYTACRYLALTPVVLAHVRGYRTADEALSPDYDPERAFWVKPSWNALEQYVEYLKQRHPDIPPQGPWPRDDVLERMKAHLALGLKGRKPEPYAVWSDIKRQASKEMSAEQMQRPAHELQYAIGIGGPLHDAISAKGGAARIIRLVRALEFPDVQPSLFRSEAELAPPGAATEEVSGRFGIVFRQLVTRRPKPKPGAEEGSGPGLYDMLTRTQVLVRPVQRVRLFRDGRLHAEPGLVRMKDTLWRDVDEPMCSDWIPGFGFGDAEERIWRYFAGDTTMPGGRNTAQKESLKRNPGGSLYAFYTNTNLPRDSAIRTETPMTLDRDDTGFVRGIHLTYDLDGDGIPDLAVWEGQGEGPGHLEGTTTDDRWYRLVLVNINGAWKVLGSDVFGYGCGC